MEATRKGAVGKAVRVLLAAALALGVLAPAAALAPGKAHASEGVKLTVGSKMLALP